jgi:hypothetical protein
VVYAPLLKQLHGLGCPRRKRLVVTSDTLSPLAKCGDVDGSVRACISFYVVVTQSVPKYVLPIIFSTVPLRLAKLELTVAC